MAELRVPLFEDKVIDFLGELVQVEDRTVPPEILYLDPDEAEEKLKAQSDGVPASAENDSGGEENAPVAQPG
jgi:hypothetical protein